jgi:ketosteroid isomerase-like protein
MRSSQSKFLVALTVAMACVPVASRSAPAPHAPEVAVTIPQSKLDIPADAQAAVLVVDNFGKALAAVDFKTVEKLLDPSVIILESGDAERSREEYMGHHAVADALFLGNAHVTLQRRTARVDGTTAWVASESEINASEDGKAMTLLSTETMVLQKHEDGWHIVHIHWSSRKKKDG